MLVDGVPVGFVSASEFADRPGCRRPAPSNWLQLVKFGLVGGSGYLINLGVFTLLGDSLGVPHPRSPR